MIFGSKALSVIMVAICSAQSIVADGAEIILMPTKMIFENGNYVELPIAKVGRDGTGTVGPPTGSMYTDQSATNLAAKIEVNDKIEIRFAALDAFVFRSVLEAVLANRSLKGLLQTTAFPNIGTDPQANRTQDGSGYYLIQSSDMIGHETLAFLPPALGILF